MAIKDSKDSIKLNYEKTDIFALGMCLLETTKGALKEIKTEQITANKMLKSELRTVSQKSFAEIIGLMTDCDPEARIKEAPLRELIVKKRVSEVGKKK